MQRMPKAINKKRLVRYKEGAEMYSMGMNKFQTLLSLLTIRLICLWSGLYISAYFRPEDLTLSAIRFDALE